MYICGCICNIHDPIPLISPSPESVVYKDSKFSSLIYIISTKSLSDSVHSIV